VLYRRRYSSSNDDYIHENWFGMCMIMSL
jgi:hypothetical protein